MAKEYTPQELRNILGKVRLEHGLDFVIGSDGGRGNVQIVLDPKVNLYLVLGLIVASQKYLTDHLRGQTTQQIDGSNMPVISITPGQATEVSKRTPKEGE